MQTDGKTLGAPIDLDDGYIHFSTAEQAAETAAKWFAAVEGLWLVAFEADEMGDALKWEPSRGGQLFPHLYRELQMGEVKWAVPLPWDGSEHRFPKDMA